MCGFTRQKSALRKFLSFAIFFLSLARGAEAQELFSDVVQREYGYFQGIELLYVIKISENEIHNRLMLVSKDPSFQTEGPAWLTRVAACSYAFMTQATEKLFPDIGAAYRERVELLSEYVRGNITARELEQLERAQDEKKRRAFDALSVKLASMAPAPTHGRIKALDEAGRKIGLMINSHAKIACTK